MKARRTDGIKMEVGEMIYLYGYLNRSKQSVLIP